MRWLRRVWRLIACTHRWPDGTSAWTPCEDKTTTCQRCGVRRKC